MLQKGFLQRRENALCMALWYNRFSEKHQSLTDTLQQLSNDRLYLQVSAGDVSPDLCYSNPESRSKDAIAVVQ